MHSRNTRAKKLTQTCFPESDLKSDSSDREELPAVADQRRGISGQQLAAAVVVADAVVAGASAWV